MFRNLVLITILALAFANIPAASKQSKALYWICYSDFYKSHSRFLMQIDSSGNIVKAPKMLSLPFQFDSAATAIAMSHSGDGNILMWFAGKGGSIFRVLINKQEMNVTQMSKIDLHTGLLQSFSATQKPDDNFLALKTTGNGLRAFPIFSSGFPILIKGSWPISPGRIGSNHQGFAKQQVGISSDGRMSFWIDTKPHEPRLYVQPLDQDGKIHGAPEFIVDVFNTPFGTFGGVDLTNELPEKRRFVVYVYRPEDRGGSIPDHLFLQVIDSDSGEKVGPRKTLYSPIEFSFPQNLAAIDPLGKFVIFEDEDLMFQALDSNGAKKGALKTLVPNITLSGIDLLLEN
jgi:hypothetical protein